MMAALCASRRDQRVVLLEKNERPGLKILISGGGRCNLTTTKRGVELEREYGETRARFLRFALREFPSQALRDMVEAAGVPLQEEDLDKIFPCSGKARDVVDALLRLVRGSGAELVTKAPMQALAREGERFVITTPRGVVRARSVVLATGGLSYPRTGATGDGYAALRAFGHGLVRPVPALAPLAVEAEWVRGLSGIVLHGVELAVQDRAGRVLRARNRPILFTHRGLSGPAPMDLSGDVEEQGGGCTLRFAFAHGWG